MFNLLIVISIVKYSLALQIQRQKKNVSASKMTSSLDKFWHDFRRSIYDMEKEGLFVAAYIIDNKKTR